MNFFAAVYAKTIGMKLNTLSAAAYRILYVPISAVSIFNVVHRISNAFNIPAPHITPSIGEKIPEIVSNRVLNTFLFSFSSISAVLPALIFVQLSTAS